MNPVPVPFPQNNTELQKFLQNNIYVIYVYIELEIKVENKI